MTWEPYWDSDTVRTTLVWLPLLVYDSLITRQSRARGEIPLLWIQKKASYSSARGSVTGRSANFHDTLFPSFPPPPLWTRLAFCSDIFNGHVALIFLSAFELEARKNRTIYGARMSTEIDGGETKLLGFRCDSFEARVLLTLDERCGSIVIQAKYQASISLKLIFIFVEKYFCHSSYNLFKEKFKCPPLGKLSLVIFHF